MAIVDSPTNPLDWTIYWRLCESLDDRYRPKIEIYLLLDMGLGTLAARRLGGMWLTIPRIQKRLLIRIFFISFATTGRERHGEEYSTFAVVVVL